MNGWTTEIENICEKLRINSVNLSEYHRKRYYYFKSYSKYFRIPLILLASINSTASVGLQRFIDQQWISLTTCIIGIIIGAITSVELYLNINSNMDLELKQSKEFYSLAVDLYKMLHLNIEHRSEEGVSYLNQKYSIYTKLSEASILLRRKLKIDVLTEIPKGLEDATPTAVDTEMNWRTRLNSLSFFKKNTKENSVEKELCFPEKKKNPSVFSEVNESLDKHKTYKSHYYKVGDIEDEGEEKNYAFQEIQ